MAPPKDRSSENLDALLDNMEDEWGETDGELPAVLRLDLAFADAGYRIQDLLVELTASDAFRLVGDPK